MVVAGICKDLHLCYNETEFTQDQKGGLYDANCNLR